MIYTSERLFKDLEGKVDSNELEEVKKEIQVLKGMMGAEPRDPAAIKTQLEKTNERVQKVTTELYQKVAQEQATHGSEPENDTGKAPKDDVVDADFEEVKDSKKPEKKK